MNRSRPLRKIHRWMSVAFTVAFLVVGFSVLRGEEPAEWVYILPLLPLAFLFLTGLYLFVLPYAKRWRSGGGRPERTAGRTPQDRITARRESRLARSFPIGTRRGFDGSGSAHTIMKGVRR